MQSNHTHNRNSFVALMLAVAVVASVCSGTAQAVPAGFTFTQTDATHGTGAVTAAVDTSPLGGPGVLNFVGYLPDATVNQKDPSIGAPVPADKVGFLTNFGSGATAEGTPNGVHVGYAGTSSVTLYADDGATQYAIDVPMVIPQDMNFRYRAVLSDDPSLGNDASGNPSFAGWIGDDGTGHRHTGAGIGFGAGQDLNNNRAATDVDSNAWGDSIGMTASVRDAFSGTIYVDSLHLAGNLFTDDQSLRVEGPAPSPKAPIIASAVNIGSNDGNDVYQVVNGGLFEDVDSFIDRTHEYNNIPAFLQGADFVRVANDDKSAGPGFQIDVTTSRTADLYLMIDNRIGDNDNNTPPTLGNGVMDWVLGQGWQQTEYEMMYDEGGDGVGPVDGFNQYATLYILENMPAGLYTLLEEQSGTNMYGFAAIVNQPSAPEPVTAMMSLMGLASLGLTLRRRRTA